jgi:drug/metabolite transporter, DME family
MKRLQPATLGTIYCLMAPLAYAAYYVCLGDVASKQNPAWVNCVQSSVGALIFGAYLAWQAVSGRRALPPWKELLTLLVIGLITQLGGVALVTAMSLIGVGVTVTLQTGILLALAAILGLVVLGESVSWRQTAAIALIVVGVAVVVFAKKSLEASAPAASAASPMPVASMLQTSLGVGMALLAGAAFAILVVGVRKTVTSATSPEAVVFLISVAGAVFLGPFCAARLGMHQLLATPPEDFGVMVGAGAMNALAFLLFSKALQWVPVVRVNVTNNALTMALTAVAGIIWFKEVWSLPLAMGIVLCIAGSVLISLGSKRSADLKDATA